MAQLLGWRSESGKYWLANLEPAGSGQRLCRFGYGLQILYLYYRDRHISFPSMLQYVGKKKTKKPTMPLQYKNLNSNLHTSHPYDNVCELHK